MSWAPPPAGWYKDPSGSDRQRYWDGTGWTDHYAAAPAPAYAYPPAPPYGYPPAYAYPPAAPRKPTPPPAAAPAWWWVVVPLTLLALAGSAGPWRSASVLGTSYSDGGLEGGGWGTIVFALIAIGMLVTWYVIAETWAAALAAGMALLALLFPLSYIADPAPDGFNFPGSGLEWSAGWGAWMALISCLALAGVSAALAFVDRRSDASAG